MNRSPRNVPRQPLAWRSQLSNHPLPPSLTRVTSRAPLFCSPSSRVRRFSRSSSSNSGKYRSWRPRCASGDIRGNILLNPFPGGSIADTEWSCRKARVADVLPGGEKLGADSPADIVRISLRFRNILLRHMLLFLGKLPLTCAVELTQRTASVSTMVNYPVGSLSLSECECVGVFARTLAVDSIHC